MDSIDKSERLLGWACKVSMLDLHREIFLKIHALKREQDQENISLKEGSSLYPLRQGQNFDITASADQREEERSAYPFTQENQKLEGKLKHRLS